LGGASFRIVDLHADLPFHVVMKRRAFAERQVLERYHMAKLRKGLVGTVITPIWVESSHKPNGALKRGLQILDAFLEDLDESDSFRIVKNYQDFLETEAEDKIGLILGVEGGELIEDDVALLRNLRRLGLRCFGFCWNQRNLMADGWDHWADDRGLTDFGKEVVQELERLGIMLDLAHVAHRSFRGIIETATKPLVVSHTLTTIQGHDSASSHARTDDELKAVGIKGGVVGICAVNEPPLAKVPDLRAYCDHVDHAVKLAGIEHVGLGPDFGDYFAEEAQKALEGTGAKHDSVKDLEDHSKLAGVLSELSRRGYSEQQIRKIARDNFARVFRETVG
jgi:membrane dipeptidase